MTTTLFNALKYLRNSGGGATKDNFIEDYEPIGLLLWDGLEKEGLVIIRDGKIYPSDKGVELLKHEKDT